MSKKELKNERESRELNFGEIIKEAKKKGVEYIEAKMLKKALSEDQIIKKLGRIDKVGGACSSQALAYIANKFGYDVKDYRGGMSLDVFSDTEILDKLTKSGGFSSINKNGFKNVENLLKYVEQGKQYYFTCGTHAAIIRKSKKNFEFIELQSTGKENGFQSLTEKKLIERFHAKEGNNEYYDFLIDIDKIKGSQKFRELIGLFNTQR